MSNTIGWGKGASNNSIGWGNVGTNGFGSIYSRSNSGETNLAGGGFDDDYIYILEYATIQGYTLPSTDQQQKQNTLIKDLKNANVWNQLDSFACFATNGDSDFALIDWKRLQMMTAVNAPVFNTNQGFFTDGISSYINTGFTPSVDGVNYSLEDASFGFFNNTSNKAGVTGFRISANNAGTFIILDSANEGLMKINGGIDNNSNNTNASNAFLHACRNGLDTVTFRNGVNTGVAETGFRVLPNQFYPIGCLNTGGVLSLFTNNEFSFFHAGSNLISEAPSFYNAIDKYKSSL